MDGAKLSHALWCNVMHGSARCVRCNVYSTGVFSTGRGVDSSAGMHG